jgi:rhamnosyltransferase
MTDPSQEIAAQQSSVCAVVVTYHPDAGLPARLSRLLPQVGRTILVDNGSGPGSAEVLRQASSGPSVLLLANTENTGIARALNAGVQAALAEGFAWALLLDQDTAVDDDIVARLLAAGDSYPESARLAVVGSKFRDTHGRLAEPGRLDARGELWQEVESVITSGSLLSLKNYCAIGPFRDDFFIDYVDTEYCFRARAAGYRILETVQPLMSHTVGAPTRHRLFGKATWTTNHSAERRYYIARNNTVLLREYGTSTSRAWRYLSFVRCLRLCKRIAYFENDKAQKISAVVQGWWDGVRGRMGPRGP